MVFVKILKNQAFFKRYQVPKKRRREGKTDFQARRKMCHQDKCKYNSKKHRLVVRLTNMKITCQIVYATIVGDIVVTQASSKELTKFGMPVGHKNYAAAYLTGFLIARRCLKLHGMDGTYKGKEKPDGEDYHVEDEEAGEDAPRPFKAILDVGLTRTCSGARIWGALKGAVDGGLHVPHNTKRFPGFKAPDERGAQGEYDAEAHKDRILGGHVKDYMEMLQEEDPTKYEAHFAKYIENSIGPDDLEGKITEAISKIKADPAFAAKADQGVTHTRKGNNITPSKGTEYSRSVKLSLKQRRDKVQAKIAAAQKKQLADAGDD